MARKLVQMTPDDVNMMVERKVEQLQYIADNMGIWGSPYQRAREDLMYWRAVQAGREPLPNKWVNEQETVNG
jgi:hypothetical protein